MFMSVVHPCSKERKLVLVGYDGAHLSKCVRGNWFDWSKEEGTRSLHDTNDATIYKASLGLPSERCQFV